MGDRSLLPASSGAAQALLCRAVAVHLGWRDFCMDAYAETAPQTAEGPSSGCARSTALSPERTTPMADPFADRLRAELDGIQAELDRLAARRRLVEELLSLESGGPAPSAAAQTRSRRAARRPAAVKRSRLPRGLLSDKIREFLGQQREPIHATKILVYLEQHDAAPRSAKPLANLQSALQRLKEMGEVENTGRNHWRLRSTEAEAAAADPPPSGAAPTISAPAPPVVTSTTRFGSTPQVDR